MATGTLAAAAVLHALHQRATTGAVTSARLSLAKTAHLLAASRREDLGAGLPPETDADIDPRIEQTAWGPARRLRFPLAIDGVNAAWDYPAGSLRSVAAQW